MKNFRRGGISIDPYHLVDHFFLFFLGANGKHRHDELGWLFAVRDFNKRDYNFQFMISNAYILILLLLGVGA